MYNGIVRHYYLKYSEKGQNIIQAYIFCSIAVVIYMEL